MYWLSKQLNACIYYIWNNLIVDIRKLISNMFTCTFSHCKIREGYIPSNLTQFNTYFPLVVHAFFCYTKCKIDCCLNCPSFGGGGRSCIWTTKEVLDLSIYVKNVKSESITHERQTPTNEITSVNISSPESSAHRI